MRETHLFLVNIERSSNAINHSSEMSTVTQNQFATTTKCLHLSITHGQCNANISNLFRN